MIRKYLKVLIVTSVVLLLPILAGVVLWEQLPEQIPTHWNLQGEVDSWSSKAFAVFGMPLILLAVQWLCAFATNADPKKANHSQKVMHMVLWIVPVVSLIIFTAMYSTALGKSVRVEVILPLILGLAFTIIGNYLPKCKQSYTIGIKLPWTLNSEENWNKTHRFAGRIWLVCGLVIMVSAFVGGIGILIAAAAVMVLVPCIYSYILHRKGI